MQEFLKKAETYGDSIAIIDEKGRYSYRDLLQKSAELATELLPFSGQCVAFIVPPSFEYVAVQWAIWRAGAIAVPLCVAHPLPALTYVLEDTQAPVIIAHPDFEDLLTPFATENNKQLWNTNKIFSKKNRPNFKNHVPKTAKAMIIYTSGTTSKPKGVVTTHQNIQAQVQTLVEAWKYQPSDHILNTLPLHHVHGVINMLSCALWAGASCEFMKFDAQKVWQRFLANEVNVFMAVPTIYSRLIAFWEEATKEMQVDFSTAAQKFRLMVSGSAALPVPVLEKWQQITSHRLLERYGMTEIGMALSNPYAGERLAGHVGSPLPQVKIRLVGEDGNIVSQGEAGEIQVKSPCVFVEYWQKEEATKAAFSPDGWFRTGDIARWTAQNAYQILGRNSVDIIKSGGYKISALEIENVLGKHPAIASCAVVGLPDETWGERVAVALVLKKNTSLELDQLKIWAKHELPTYKIPTRLLLLDELPKNTLGKIVKKELKKLF